MKPLKTAFSFPGIPLARALTSPSTRTALRSPPGPRRGDDQDDYGCQRRDARSADYLHRDGAPAAAAGSPEGTVSIVDHGTVIGTPTLTPTTSSSPRYAFSEATYTLTQPPGGSAYFFGKHSVSTTYDPSGGFNHSKALKTFTVSKPAYTALAGGVKIETIAHGSGPQIQSGQTASVLYTGYLAKNGHIFDDSINDGGAPFSFTLGTGQVIPGFDEGAVGMQVGETRIVFIPPAEGYGKEANGPIPGNSTLIFVLTLESIS